MPNVTLDRQEREAARAIERFEKTVLQNPFIHHTPTWPQARFLMTPHLEALYGGAAGGGKSDALLMAALQYYNVSGYSAIIFRRTYKDLMEADAIASRAQLWVAQWRKMGLDVRWSGGDLAIHFPKYGSRIVFRHLQHENDKFNYQGAAYQYHRNST